MRTFEEAKSKVMSSLMRNMERYKKELEDQRLNEGVKAAVKKICYSLNMKLKILMNLH